MKCDYCGYDNKPDVRCCGFCGVELDYKEKQTTEQKYDSGYIEYKEEREKEERRKRWERMFQAEQKRNLTPWQPVYQKGNHYENPVSERQEKEQNSLGYRLKRIPGWLKIVLIILLFSEPATAVFFFVIWMIYDQSKHRS